MNGGAKDEFGLTLKQRKFCQAYIGEANGNGTEAARIAGYEGDDATLGQVAYENLSKPDIVFALAAMRQEAETKAEVKILSAAEVLGKLSDICDEPGAKLSDRIRAMELVGRYHKLFADRVVFTSEETDSLTDAEAAKYGLPVPGRVKDVEDKTEGPAS